MNKYLGSGRFVRVYLPGHAQNTAIGIRETLCIIQVIHNARADELTKRAPTRRMKRHTERVAVSWAAVWTSAELGALVRLEE